MGRYWALDVQLLLFGLKHGLELIVDQSTREGVVASEGDVQFRVLGKHEDSADGGCEIDVALCQSSRWGISR